MPLIILVAVLALKVIKGILGFKNASNRYYLLGKIFDKITEYLKTQVTQVSHYQCSRLRTQYLPKHALGSLDENLSALVVLVWVA